MASLYFHYSTMNAGKSTHALTTAFNYKERNMRTLLVKPAVDSREQGVIASRIGISETCCLVEPHEMISHLLTPQTKLYGVLEQHKHFDFKIDCVIVDEAQFLTAEQVYDLTKITDLYNIPVMCYGLRTDFQGKMFEGSKALFELADKLVEIKTICWCGKKATMVVRTDSNGDVIRDGEQVVIGGNECYISLCRKHFKSGQTHNE